MTAVSATDATQDGIETLLPFRGRRRHDDYAWLTPSQQAVRDRIDSVRTALPGRHRSGGRVMTAVAVRELHPGDEWHCLDWTLHVSSDAQVEGNSAAFAVAEFPWLMHRPADEVLDVKVAGS